MKSSRPSDIARRVSHAGHCRFPWRVLDKVPREEGFLRLLRSPQRLTIDRRDERSERFCFSRKTEAAPTTVFRPAARQTARDASSECRFSAEAKLGRRVVCFCSSRKASERRRQRRTSARATPDPVRALRRQGSVLPCDQNPPVRVRELAWAADRDSSTFRSREECSKGVAEDQSRVLALDEQVTVRWPRGAVGT
jgi:hypothetical protein